MKLNDAPCPSAALATSSCSTAPAGQNALRVYVPRTAEVAEGPILRLGRICVVRCDDAVLLGKAAGVALGRSPWAREKIAVDRRTIVSRLATCGIDAESVTLSGAQAVEVSRDEKTIPAAEIVREADRFLTKHRPGGEAAGWQLARTPAAMTVPGADDIRLLARTAKSSPRGYVLVEVAAVSLGRELGVRELLYQVAYTHRQVVATKAIATGEPITRQNAKAVNVSVSRPPPRDQPLAFGMVAARPIEPGTVLRLGVVRPAKPKVVVKRNDVAVMRVRGAGFVITAKGRALQDGRPGDLIRVRNVDSRRVVVARVEFDGTLEPIADNR
jgi:flagella basal body P-ring formation protein FlgA